MRKFLIAAVLAALIPLSACGPSQPTYGGICVDRYTQVRYDDYYCNGGYGNNYGYYYIDVNSSKSYPRVGSKVNKSDYKTSKPKDAKVVTGLSTSGGSHVSDFKKSDAYKKATKTKSTGSKSKSTGSKNKSTTTRRR